MKRLPSYLLQLLVIVVLVGGVLYSTLKPKPPPYYEPATWKSWEGVYVLSYTGILRSADPKHPQQVAESRFKEQLAALQDAGYRTVKLADVLAYLKGQKPLPEKPLLLLFEANRKDSFLRATPYLLKYRLLGNMAVPLKLTHEWGNFYLKEGELGKVCRHPNWDLVSMGNQAIDQIVIDDQGAKGHFLTQRLWQAGKKEEDQAFRQRLTEDYVTAAKTLNDACGHRVIAYLYPYADSGVGAGADPLAAEINHQELEAHHLLAFTRAGDPFNGPYSDPYDLTRLRVPGDWDGKRLVAELAKFAPHQEPVAGMGNRDSWQFVNDAQLVEGVIRLVPDSSAWVRGTDNWSDADLKTRIRLAPGARGSLYARYASTRSYLRLSLTDQELLLQEHLDKAMQTLVRVPIKKSPDLTYTLRLRVKGNRAAAWVDDAAVIQAAPVAPVTRMGRVGIGAQGGEVQVLEFSGTPLRDIVYVLAGGYGQLPANIKDQARAIIPPWFSLASSPQISPAQRTEALLAASQGVETIPAVSEAGSSGDPDRWAADLATALSSSQLQSVITTVAVKHGNARLIAALEKQGLRVLVILPAKQALELPVDQLRAERQLLLIDGPETETRAALERLLHFLPANRMVVRLDALGPVPLGVRPALKY